MGLKLDSRFYEYDRFNKITCLTPYEEIEVGEEYHIPPTILYDRRDILVDEKTSRYIGGYVTYPDGSVEHQKLFAQELSIRFLVKKWTL